jgi:hypothetical protein
MLKHVLARLLTFVTLFGTLLHVLIIRKLVARLSAPSAHIGTGSADLGRERSASGHDLGGRCTDIRTILARRQGRDMLALALVKLVRAMSRA